MERLSKDAHRLPADKVQFNSPVANPTKIIGTPANYAEHTEEMKRDTSLSGHSGSAYKTIEQQGLFLKANSALVGPAEGVSIKFPERRTDHEAELGVIIGKQGTDISEEHALEYVAGYAIALDMVIRGPEDRSFRKSLDSFAVLGPWMVTADEFGNPEDANFELLVNGERRQATNTSEMIISVPQQIAWASSIYTLYPGDVIMTGTCQGVGPVRPGDRMSLTFDRIGQMDVDVHARR
jgi:2-keto-4-pentenoate hydratase/2-oxohepta-3-ene-1,7-dioic acid hydratase in catechol pathway